MGAGLAGLILAMVLSLGDGGQQVLSTDLAPQQWESLPPPPPYCMGFNPHHAITGPLVLVAGTEPPHPVKRPTNPPTDMTPRELRAGDSGSLSPMFLCYCGDFYWWIYDAAHTECPQDEIS